MYPIKSVTRALCAAVLVIDYEQILFDNLYREASQGNQARAAPSFSGYHDWLPRR